uniref:dolichyl-diphosphooligosaccharide--protein glycotransferase n=1 Tax=Piliocolobus tephrosceles TaxID=591936 RepID=A0A8C9GGD4_9PRIM
RMEISILLLIGILSFINRLFSVLKTEPIIHEYDPYFNYKLTNILCKKGFYHFWNYFDDRSWFPYGRETGQTLYPGLMLTSCFIYKLYHMFGLLIDIKIICIYIGPFFSFFTCILTYLLTKRINNTTVTGSLSSSSALLASLFISTSPSLISRTVAGSYDNESISIFLLLLCIYTWINCLQKGTLLSSMICSVSTFYMALSWGAYIFVINWISLFILIIIILKKYTIRHLLIYNVYYILTTILCLNIPTISRSVFSSVEHLMTHAIFILSNFLLFLHFLIYYIKLNENFVKNLFIIICFIIFILIFKFVIFDNKVSWNHRSNILLDPTHAAKHNPIVASISEHQPTTCICTLFMLFFFVILIILHSTWCSAIAYSESNITFFSRNKNGKKGRRYINDDLRQMYSWIYENTPPNSKIIAWWDYGYQLSVMSDRITYNDNNTRDINHIATVGLIFSNNEEYAYKQLKKLNADYVLVTYGGYSLNTSDDLNKFIWILKITNNKYKYVNPLLYFYHEEYHPLSSNGTTLMTSSLLYKLSYFNITNSRTSGYDHIRKIKIPQIKNLTYFEEQFTTDVWGYRLYKVKKID